MSQITFISIYVVLVLSLEAVQADPVDQSNVFVTFGHGTTTNRVISQLNFKSFTSRADRVTSLTAALKENAKFYQEKVLEFLDQEKLKMNSELSVTSFWISNQLFITGATPELIDRISRFEGVTSVGPEANYYLDAPFDTRSVPIPAPGEIQWGIRKVQAPETWKTGNNGAGIVVGTIDTGARVSHETLADNYVGNYGWFDPYKGQESPLDEVGHGTHTLATIVGTHGVGVAPGAKWMTCRGCYKGFCTPEALLACGQFLLCPTDVKGENPDCSKAPHIASNSFGGGQGRPLLWPVFDSWQAAGILIVFSNGNSGWGVACGTANSHADANQVIGVGGTTSDDTLYVRSSVGPSVYGTLKPDISAPGVDVVSAYHTADNAYEIMSGTSMAAPHVAGAIAILLSERRGLSLEKVKEYLTQGAEKNLGRTGRSCGGIPEDEFPNHTYGGGRINILRSLQILRARKLD